MFGSAPTAWIERLVRMPRSRRVYKPAMLLAALDAIDAGASAAHVPLDDLLDRFDDLLERSGLRGDTSKGFQPAYHLSDSGAPPSPVPFWSLRRGATAVHGLAKPGTNAALRRAADAVALLPSLAVEVATLDARQAVREAIYDLLERDGDAECLALVRVHDVSYADVQADQQRLRERLLQPFRLDDPAPRRCLARREQRSRRRAFAADVLAAYERACALCELRIQWGDLVEAEAAHIKPHALDGADDLRNGLALCRTHHWSFDRGLWSATDATIVEVVSPDVAAAQVVAADLGSLQQFRGRRLRPPTLTGAGPHRDALVWHRRNLYRGAGAREE